MPVTETRTPGAYPVTTTVSQDHWDKLLAACGEIDDVLGAIAVVDGAICAPHILAAGEVDGKDTAVRIYPRDGVTEVLPGTDLGVRRTYYRFAQDAYAAVGSHVRAWLANPAHEPADPG